jgi:adenine-specific DNA-methyltransferase
MFALMKALVTAKLERGLVPRSTSKMGRNSNFNSNLKTLGVEALEKELVLQYLLSNRIAFQDSSIVTGFLEGFHPNAEFNVETESFKHYNLKHLENCLELLIPENDRKLNGAFFTPEYVVNFIIDELSPTEDAKNLDPSCGSGAFLLGLVEYYVRKYNKSVKSVVRENIFGADILQYNIDRCKLLLAIYALQQGEILEPCDFNLQCHDSLRFKWKVLFDNIVGNPPYVKFQDLSADSRSFLQVGWETVKGGTFNLYFAFFELGYRLLKADGNLAFITPNNFFTSLSGESLRSFFLKYKAVRRILDFSHVKVFDAQTYTAITFLSKAPKEEITYDRIKNGIGPEAFLECANGSPNNIQQLSPKKWRLLRTDEQQNIRNIESAGIPLGKLVDICVGIATLKDIVFFVDGPQIDNSYYLKTTPNGTFRIESEVTRPVYKVSDFKTQGEVNSNSRRIIFPYLSSGENVRPIPENEFQKLYPGCYEYLCSEKEVLLARDKGKVHLEPFFIWGRSQGLTRKGKRLISPTFSMRPRFLAVEEYDSFFTNGYGIFFRKNSQHLLVTNTNSLGLEENADVLQKILNSEIMNYYVSKTSVSIEGGYPCYQKNFIEKFTIPEFSTVEIDELRSLESDNSINFLLSIKYQVNLPSPNLRT